MKKILVIISVLFFFKCSEQKKNVPNDSYEVLYLLYNDITTHHIKMLSFPPIPPEPSISWDSIKKLIELDRKVPKDTLKKIDFVVKQSGKLIVAIQSKLFVPYLDDFKKEYIKEYLKEYENIFDSLKEFKEPLEMDVSKIPINKYSYIFPYQEYYKKMTSKGYDKYDIILSFSRISFNKNKTKAIVIMGVGFGKLNGFSAMYFLEKKQGNWKIKFEEGLTIS
jgi:hypothetical protein